MYSMRVLWFIAILFTVNIGAFARKAGPYTLTDSYNSQDTLTPASGRDYDSGPSPVLYEDNTTESDSSSFVKTNFELIYERIYYILIYEF